MGIRDETDYKAIESELNKFVARAERAILRTLRYAAEQVINIAREKGNYKDQTANLRSSIGAVIVVDGKIEWRSAFEAHKGGQVGANQGKVFAEQLATKYPQGIALIVVAGKEYAAHVSNRGYDVLDSAELQAEELIPRLLKQLF